MLEAHKKKNVEAKVKTHRSEIGNTINEEEEEDMEDEDNLED